ATMATAVIAKAGDRFSVRRTYRTSWRRMSRWTSAAFPATSAIAAHQTNSPAIAGVERSRRSKIADISAPYSFRNDVGYRRSTSRYHLIAIPNQTCAIGNPLGFSRREAARPRHAHEIRQPACFRFRDRGAERRHPVVAPALVVVFRRRPLARLDDQSLLEH